MTKIDLENGSMQDPEWKKRAEEMPVLLNMLGYQRWYYMLTQMITTAPNPLALEFSFLMIKARQEQFFGDGST